MLRPMTLDPFRAKARLLRPRRSCFGPAETHVPHGLGWSRRVLPPGPKGLLQRPFIAIAGFPRHPEYRRKVLTKEVPVRHFMNQFLAIWPSRRALRRRAKGYG